MAVREHELKIWPNYFEPMRDGIKSFEVRNNDRDFQPGDFLHLREWDPNDKTYSGRELRRKVGYLLRGPAFGIEPGYCVFSVEAI